MTPESAADGALRTNIIISRSTLAPGTVDPRNPPCGALAEAVQKQFQAKVSDVATVSVNGDAGCRWTYVTSEARVHQRVRFQGNQEIVLQWTRMNTLSDTQAVGDRRVWQDVLAVFDFTE